jgi:orotidine-5'-phosphate decarboxylase
MHRPPSDLIVSLESLSPPHTDRVLEVVRELGDLPVIYQVGIELFMCSGPSLVRELVHQKKRVFLDLKFHDAPDAVAGAVVQAALLRVELVSLHLSGGSAMLHAVRDALSEFESIRPKVIGVGVLPSFDDLRWAEVSRAINGHASDLESSMDGLIEAFGGAFGATGVDGILCRPQDLSRIHERHPALYTVSPGMLEGVIVGPDRVRPSAIIVGEVVVGAGRPRETASSLLSSLAA